MKVSNVQYVDLKYIALLHKSRYSNLHLTKFFSLDLLCRYYNLFINLDGVNFLKISDNDEIHGFIVFGNVDVINKTLLKFKKEYLHLIFLLFFKNPYLFVKVIFKVFSRKPKTDYENGDIILSIVSSQKQKGIGEFILNYVKNSFDIEQLYLHVNTSEVKTLNFYLRQGFVIHEKNSNEYIMSYSKGFK